MRSALAVLAIVAAFVCGARSASSEPKPKYAGVPEEFLRRHKLLAGDLKKIRRAARDLNDIRAQIKAGFTYLNETEREMQRDGRKDFHIFMERARNDTLEVLALYERALKLRTYVDPLEELFGKSFSKVVEVAWEDIELDDILDELSEAYGVTMLAKGEFEDNVSVSLTGEMTLQAIIYYVESQWDVRAVVKGKEIWFERLADEETTEGDDKGGEDKEKETKDGG